jgi:glucose-6-phosphate isomerase
LAFVINVISDFSTKIQFPPPGVLSVKEPGKLERTQHTAIAVAALLVIIRLHESKIQLFSVGRIIESSLPDTVFPHAPGAPAGICCTPEFGFQIVLSSSSIWRKSLQYQPLCLRVHDRKKKKGTEGGKKAVFFRPSQLSSSSKQEVLSRLWAKDPSLWTGVAEVQDQVRNGLGWLDVVPKMKEVQADIAGFAGEVVRRGIDRVVILGMGGSSLCPLVLSKVFGSQQGFPELIVLDTTDPQEVEKVEKVGSWGSTLFVVASKSGTTVEPNAQFNYFWSLLDSSLEDPGSHFVAITDPNTPLESLAKEHGFWRIFLNPSDIGGRYSALSYFGLVPAALLGLDVGRILTRAEDMIGRCGPEIPWEENPGCKLAEFFAEFGLQNRDKLSILADPPLKPFGLWLEQLVAESTGKETRGLVPIAGESTGIPGFYGPERIFVYFRMKGTPDENSLCDFVSELRQAAFPVYEIWLDDLYDLGGQFFLWEIATALSCHFFDVNAFDQPDVRLVKEKTGEVLDVYRAQGKMPVKFWIDPQSQMQFRPSKILASSMKGLSRALRDIFQVLPTWGYLAFLPYLPYDAEVEEIIGEMRHVARQERGCATTLGFGPRYLHSTGQIHKGGPFASAFLIFTRKRAEKYPVIPGFDVSFWHMQFAQAIGDFEALSDARRRVIHVHLSADYLLGLRVFSKVFSRAVKL